VKNIILLAIVLLSWQQTLAQDVTPRTQPGSDMSLYTPEQHTRYDGHFVLSASRIYQVGQLNDPPGWDHMGNDASNVQEVKGSVEIDVDEIKNTGRFVARLTIPEGELVLEMKRFHEFNPCQDGGVAAYLYEHGDAECGDTNWPKTFVYIAGWGYGQATLNGKVLYEDDHEMHFMVIQGVRDRQTLQVQPYSADTPSLAGGANPATQQLDFYIRSPEADQRNSPGRKVFDHFFGMEVTWK
jgi:hypothetical protein